MLWFAGVSARVNRFFGEPFRSTPIILDDVGCTGNEESLMECYHRGYGINDCPYYNDAGVECVPSK